MDTHDEDVQDGVFFSLSKLLELCRDKLDKPVRDKKPPREVSFVILLDCCRVSITGIADSIHSAARLEAESGDKAPMDYWVCSSCSRGGEAEDGPAGGHSPFANELLNPEAGIFEPGRKLMQGLKDASARVQRRTKQLPLVSGRPVFSEELCLNLSSPSCTVGDDASEKVVYFLLHKRARTCVCVCKYSIPIVCRARAHTHTNNK